MKKIYTAADESTAQAALDEFEASELAEKYPHSVKVWRDAWARFVPFLQFPPAARKVIYDDGFDSNHSTMNCVKLPATGCSSPTMIQRSKRYG